MNGVYVFYTEFRQLLESVWTVWWCKFGSVLMTFKLYHLAVGPFGRCQSGESLYYIQGLVLSCAS